jgi:uncharacterized protein
MCGMVGPPLALLAAIGVASGVLSGLFGIGGGIVIVPALIYLAGFNQHLATGTSLAILLPPVGAAAALEYYRHGNVNVRAAVVIAATLLASGWIGAALANRIAGPYLRLAFGLFVTGLGISLIYGALQRLRWV